MTGVSRIICAMITGIHYAYCSSCSVRPGTNEIFQYSVLNALDIGEAEDGIVPSSLSAEGSIGLGAWYKMDGELIMVDGIVYEMLGNGSVAVAPDNRTIPYASATFFKGQRRLLNQTIDTNNTLEDALNRIFPNKKNNFISYVIDGHFPHIKARATGGEKYPGENLTSVSSDQNVFSFYNATGTMVGFKSPYPWQDIKVLGEHTHYISADRKQGGHVLEMTGSEVTIEAALAPSIRVVLPTTDAFNEADLNFTDSAITKVENN